MPPRKKIKTAAKAIDTKSSVEAANTGHADAVNTTSSTESVGITESTGDADPTSSTERRPTGGRSRATRAIRSIDTGPRRTTRQTGKKQQSTLKRKARDEAQEGDDNLSDNIANADTRPMQAAPQVAEQPPAEQDTGFRERSSAVLPQVPPANGGPATSAHLAVPQVPTVNDGSATSAQPARDGDIQELAEARRILTSRDPNTDPNAVKMFRQIDGLLRAMGRNDANGKAYDQTRAMLRVRLDQVERNTHAKAPAIQPPQVPQEPRMAFPGPDYVLEHPLPWTRKYWAYQSDVQKAKAVPPPDRPTRKPLTLKGPDKKMITHTQCRERQNLLRTLQFDLVSTAYSLSLKAKKESASQRQSTDDDEMLKRLEAGLENLSKVKNKGTEVEWMRKLGSKSSPFEGCQKPTQQNFKPLKADEVAKLRELAKKPQGTGRNFNKTRYDKCRGMLWYELDELELLLKEFADEEARHADRTRTGARIRALCELAQPLNLGSLPTEAEAKTLLSAQILQENIENKDSSVINHYENWSFVRQFETARRQQKYFSMSECLPRRPTPITSRDAAYSSSDEESESSSSSSSSPTPVERPPYASQIPNQAEPFQGDVDNRFAGRTPYERPGLGDTAVEGSSTQGPYEVGSGMLIPPEILGVDPRVRGMPDEHGFSHTQGFTMPGQQYGGEGQTRTHNITTDERIIPNPSDASFQPRPLLPTNGPTGKRPAPTDLASAYKRVAVNHDLSAQVTAVPAMMSAFQPSSTIPGQDATNTRPQMQPPLGPLKDSRKRPPPIEPASSRKKPFTDFREQRSSSSSSGSGGSAGSSGYSGSLENNTAPPRPMRTPMSSTFRSPRKAPAPPKDPEQQKIPGTELTEDDLFAIGFPEHFGPAKKKGGAVEPATNAVRGPVVSQPNVPRPMSSHARPGIPGPKGNANEPATKQATSAAPASVSRTPAPRPTSSHNTFEIAHDALGLPSFGARKPGVLPTFGASSFGQPSMGMPSSFGNPLLPHPQPQNQVPSAAAPTLQTPQPPTAPAPPRITPPSTTRSSLPPMATQSPLRNLPTMPPEPTGDEEEEPWSSSSEVPSPDDDEDPGSDNEDLEPTPKSRAVEVMQRAVSDAERDRLDVEARHTREEARILRSIRVKGRGRREDDDDDGEQSADAGGGTGGTGGPGPGPGAGVPSDPDMPDEDDNGEEDFDDYFDKEIGEGNGGGDGGNKERQPKNQRDDKDDEERETWTRGHAGVSTRGRVSLPPEEPRNIEGETEDLDNLEQELMMQFEAEAEAEASNRVFRAPVARMVSEEPGPEVGGGGGAANVEEGDDNVSGEGGRDGGRDGEGGNGGGAASIGDTSGDFWGELGSIGSGASQIDWGRYPETNEATSTQIPQDLQNSSNIDDLFEMEGETDEIDWDNETLGSVS